jgi:hypothetical protein
MTATIAGPARLSAGLPVAAPAARAIAPKTSPSNVM